MQKDGDRWRTSAPGRGRASLGIAVLSALTAIVVVVLGAQYASAYFKPRRDQVVFVGDSITFGQGASDPASASRSALFEEHHGDRSDVVNLGVNGITLGSIAGSRQLADLYRPRARNVAVILAGSNDLQQGAKGAELYEILRRYATELKDDGWAVTVGTVLGRSFPPEKERERLTLNRLIRSGTLTAAGIVTIDYAGAQDKGEVPLSDGIHPSDAGYVTMARLEDPVIMQALGSR
jgi:lysophospholipase L1-like esterase